MEPCKKEKKIKIEVDLNENLEEKLLTLLASIIVSFCIKNHENEKRNNISPDINRQAEQFLD